MPIRAWLLLVALLLNGCSIWPNQEHRALTAQTVESIIAKQCSTTTNNTQTAAIEQQQVMLTNIQAQLDMLTKATPGFTNAHCAPNESPNNHEFEGKVLVGANEWIHLSPPGHHYQARIDSGAATSSLSAKNIEYFERNGKRWVSFELQHDDEADAISVEAKVIRHVLIRQASSPEPERRPVVSLTVNMGQDLRYDTEFTLTNRSQMTYPILLGREFLRDVILIDVGRQFIHPKYVPQDLSRLDTNTPTSATFFSKLAQEQP
jgi:hypothetical protein